MQVCNCRIVPELVHGVEAYGRSTELLAGLEYGVPRVLPKFTREEQVVAEQWSQIGPHYRPVDLGKPGLGAGKV